ncbi:MAG: DUF2752 domain-containing protein, partial [Tepidisphaeraceae bacterium]
IYLRAVPVPRLNWGCRLLAALIGFGCLAVLVVAVQLWPNSAGVGTHGQLGWDACGFLIRTGLPCPSCGMTTSFSWFVRGNLPASLYVQPMGTVLALGAGLTFWAGLYIALTGKPAHRLLRAFSGPFWLVAGLFLGVAAWAWKIAIHLRGIDG